MGSFRELGFVLGGGGGDGERFHIHGLVFEIAVLT
jgi:hypothetical protein